MGPGSNFSEHLDYHRGRDHSLPQGVLGYAEVTSNQASLSADNNLTGLSVTVTVGESRRIKVTGKVQMASVSSTPDARVFVMESSTELGSVGRYDFGTNQTRGASQASVVLTPSAGSHTYHLRFFAVTGTYTLEASSTNPAFILVEDVGAA